jgi:hypothetical protein
MEEMLVKEETRRILLKDVFKEIRKEIKKAIKQENGKGSIDTKVKQEKPAEKPKARHRSGYSHRHEEHSPLKYENLFDYLQSLKPNEYQYGSDNSESSSRSADPSHDLREDARKFIEQMKMDKLMGRNRDYERTKQSEAYLWFKVVHGKGVTELLYDLSFI